MTGPPPEKKRRAFFPPAKKRGRLRAPVGRAPPPGARTAVLRPKTENALSCPRSGGGFWLGQPLNRRAHPPLRAVEEGHRTTPSTPCSSLEKRVQFWSGNLKMNQAPLPKFLKSRNHFLQNASCAASSAENDRSNIRSPLSSREGDRSPAGGGLGSAPPPAIRLIVRSERSNDQNPNDQKYFAPDAFLGLP